MAGDSEYHPPTSILGPYLEQWNLWVIINHRSHIKHKLWINYKLSKTLYSQKIEKQNCLTLLITIHYKFLYFTCSDLTHIKRTVP